MKFTACLLAVTCIVAAQDWGPGGLGPIYAGTWMPDSLDTYKTITDSLAVVSFETLIDTLWHEAAIASAYQGSSIGAYFMLMGTGHYVNTVTLPIISATEDSLICTIISDNAFNDTLSVSDSVTHPGGGSQSITFVFSEPVLLTESPLVIVRSLSGSNIRMQTNGVAGPPYSYYYNGAWNAGDQPTMTVHCFQGGWRFDHPMYWSAPDSGLVLPRRLLMGGLEITANADSSRFEMQVASIDTLRTSLARLIEARIYDAFVSQGSRAGACSLFTTDHNVALDEYTLVSDTTDNINFTLPALSTAWDTTYGVGIEYNFYNQGTGVLAILQHDDDTLSLGGQDSLHVAQYSGLKLQAASDSLWAVFAGGGGGGGWSGDSLDLRILIVSDSAYIDTLEAHYIAGASPVTFLDPIDAPRIDVDTLATGALDLSDTLFISDLQVEDLYPINLTGMDAQYEIVSGPDSVSWQEYSTLLTYDATTSRSIDMAIAPDNTQHFVLEQGSNAVHVSRSPGGVWSGATTVGSGYSSARCRIAVDSNGIPVVIYADNTNDVIVSYWSGAAWVEDTTFAVSNYIADIACHGTTAYFAYYSASNTITLATQTSRDGSWTEETVDASAGTDRAPFVEIDTGGNPVVLNYGYYYEKVLGSWTEVSAYAAATYTAYDFAINPVTNIKTVFLRKASSTYYNYVSEGTISGFALTQVGASSSYSYPTGCFDAGGTPHLFTTLVADYALKAFYYDGANWSAMDPPSGTIVSSSYMASAMRSDSILVVAWCNEDGATDYLHIAEYAVPLGRTTGRSALTTRINSAINGLATGMMFDPGGYGNIDTTSGDLWLGNPTGANDDVSVYGHFFPPIVNDAGPMTATNGTAGEIVYNRADQKFYGCTVTGTPATWAAFN